MTKARCAALAQRESFRGHYPTILPILLTKAIQGGRRQRELRSHMEGKVRRHRQVQEQQLIVSDCKRVDRSKNRPFSAIASAAMLTVTQEEFGHRHVRLPEF